MIPISPKNAIKALIRLGRSVFRRKNPILSVAGVEKRLAVCEKCPRFVPDGRQCSACTCFVDLKANLTTETCPEGRWP